MNFHTPVSPPLSRQPGAGPPYVHPYGLLPLSHPVPFFFKLKCHLRKAYEPAANSFHADLLAEATWWNRLTFKKGGKQIAGTCILIPGAVASLLQALSATVNNLQGLLLPSSSASDHAVEILHVLSKLP